jgi:hypothetical protein
MAQNEAACRGRMLGELAALRGKAGICPLPESVVTEAT